MSVKAPKNATHKATNGCFYEVCGDRTGLLDDDGMEISYDRVSNYPNFAKWEVLKREWSGPEDGLPPVGTVCEHKRVHEWQQIEVFAVKPNYNGSNTALFTYGNGCWGGCAEPSFFRAIPGPAQLRETAIREIMDAAGIDCLVTATRLVDAGFKREVV